jgi:hypothetical protein
MMKPPSQVGNGKKYPLFDSPDRGVMPTRMILGIRQDTVQADSIVGFDPLDKKAK